MQLLFSKKVAINQNIIRCAYSKTGLLILFRFLVFLSVNKFGKEISAKNRYYQVTSFANERKQFSKLFG